MDKQTAKVLFTTTDDALNELRILRLTKLVIAELDKRNRARRLNVYNKLPAINYDVEHIENLSRTCQGKLQYAHTIIKFISTLNLEQQK